MAAAFDKVTTQSGSSTSFNHSPVDGAPTLAVFTAAWDGNADGTSDITGVTYGGQNMTQKAFRGSAGATNGPTTQHVVEIWTLESPPSGTQAVVITRAGSTPKTEAYSLRTYTGTGTVGTASLANDGTGTTNSCSLTGISSETNGIVIDAFVTQENEDCTADAGQTERFDVGDSTSLRHGGSDEPGAASVNVGWSWTTNSDWAYAAVPVAPAAAPAAGTVTTVANVSVQKRPAPPTITSSSVVGSQATVKISPSTEGWPARWYQKKASATTYLLDGMSTAGTTSWVYYNLAGLTNYDLGVSHYNTTGRIESVWDTTSTNVTVSTLGARRVSGRVVG